jgi:hypothetical protein
MVSPHSGARAAGRGAQSFSETRTVTNSKHPVDQRPFKSRADLEREQALEAHYGRLAIPEVVAATRRDGLSRGRPDDDKKSR